MKTYNRIKNTIIRYFPMKKSDSSAKLPGVTIPKIKVPAVPSPLATSPVQSSPVLADNVETDAQIISRLTRENNALKAELKTARVGHAQKATALATTLKELSKKLDGSIKNNVVYRNAYKDDFGKDACWYVTRKDNGTVYLSTNGQTYLMLNADSSFLSMPEYVQFLAAKEMYPLGLSQYRFQGSAVKIDITSTTTL